MLRTFSALMQRSGLANLLGKSFGGKRDLYEVFGYKHNLQFQDLLAMYERQDITARILEAPSSAIWSNPPAILSTDDEWNTAWNNIVQRQSLWFVLNRLDNLAGLGRYACLFVGVDGEGLNAKPDKPLSPGTYVAGKRNVLYLQPYSEPAAHILSVSNDSTSARYLMPDFYDLKPFLNQPLLPGQKTISSATMRVHASRILHVAEGTLEDTLIGRPRLEKLANRLNDMDKIAGGTAETYWLAANRGMHADIDKEMELNADDEKALTDELEEYQHQLRRWVRTRGVTINSLGSDTPDPRGVFNVLLALLSSGSGIPQRVMTGAEAGQLASAQDRANWAERVEERRKLFAEPSIIWPLIRLFTDAGILPQKQGMKVSIKWETAFRLSPLEEAAARAQQARSAVNLSRTLTDQQTRAKNANTPQVITTGPTEQVEGGAVDSTGVSTDKSSKNKKNAPKLPPKGQAFPPAVGGGTFTPTDVQEPSTVEKAMGEIFINIAEARHFVGLEKLEPTFDDVGDVSSTKTLGGEQ